MSPITCGVIFEKSTFGNRLVTPKGMLRNGGDSCASGDIKLPGTASGLQERHGSEASMHDCAQGHGVPWNLVILLGRPPCSIHAIPIAVPTLNSTKTVIY